MPIYAYKCETCGHAKDVLQKMSDALLTVCPSCGASTLVKQVTAAGFQLKGSGWYVTDFRDGGGKKGEDGKKGDDAKPKGAGASDAASAGSTDAPAANATSSVPSAPSGGAPAPAAAVPASPAAAT